MIILTNKIENQSWLNFIWEYSEYSQQDMDSNSGPWLDVYPSTKVDTDL